ncbi:MAG TPA: heavy-metal-associated domain-containing protein [Polyangiaceae bacterium]|nr:heavy-metal-associated domain-containing protein [Polyangiaceae bacterium]
MKTIASFIAVVGLLGALLVPSVAVAKTVNESWYLAGPRSGADVKRVERAVQHLPGVKSFEVSEATLDIRFDDQKLTDARLRAAVAHAGNFRLHRPTD